MTDLQTAMQAAYETAFGESMLPLNTGGKDFPIRPDELSDQQIAAFFRYGKRALNDSYNSDAKVARDAGKAVPNPKEYFAEWLDIFGTNKPRGGGSRLSPETKGWITYFNSKGSLVKFKSQACNGTNLDKYQLALTKKAIWPSIKAHLQTLDESAQREFHQTKLPELLEKHKTQVLEKYEQDMSKGSGVGWFIQQEIAKQFGKPTNNTLTIDIDITM